jgi:hypothetical protein
LSKPRKNRIREERIQNESIVDAYGPEEQALGWYYLPGEQNQVSLLGPMRDIARLKLPFQHNEHRISRIALPGIRPPRARAAVLATGLRTR